MKSISIYEIKQNFDNYVKQIRNGESLIVTFNDIPCFEMKPVRQTLQEPRPFGLCRGEFHVPDDFDDPLPEYLIEEFEGNSKT